MLFIDRKSNTMNNIVNDIIKVKEVKNNKKKDQIKRCFPDTFSLVYQSLKSNIQPSPF